MSITEVITNRVMVQLRVNAFVDGEIRDALNNVYTDAENTEKVIEILLEAQEKIRNLSNDDMRKVR